MLYVQQCLSGGNSSPPPRSVFSRCLFKLNIILNNLRMSIGCFLGNNPKVPLASLWQDVGGPQLTYYYGKLGCQGNSISLTLLPEMASASLTVSPPPAPLLPQTPPVCVCVCLIVCLVPVGLMCYVLFLVQFFPIYCLYKTLSLSLNMPGCLCICAFYLCSPTRVHISTVCVHESSKCHSLALFVF